jgi:hypothetical protein
MTPGEIVEIHREQRNHMMAEATALECGKRTHLTMIGGQMVDVSAKEATDPRHRAENLRQVIAHDEDLNTQEAS